MKRIDQIYAWRLSDPLFGAGNLQCRLRIFQLHPEIQTVILSEMNLIMQWLLPSLIEPLVDQVVQEFQLEPTHLVWLEQHTLKFREPAIDVFNQVTFAWCNGKAIHPQWSAISPRKAQTLITGSQQTVAEIVSQA
jgi:hypothetical protein